MSQKITIILIISSIVLGSVLISGAIIYSGKNSQLLYLASLNEGNLPSNSPQPSNILSSKYDAKTLENFAKCLTEKGLKFYGAWWCPHCQNQKAIFEDAFQYVNYVECEKNPGTSQGDLVTACVQANIEAYPTWILADGTKKTGEMPLETLAQISSCPLE